MDIFIFQWWQTTLANNHNHFRESQVNHLNLFLAWKYPVHFENQQQVMELERDCDNLTQVRNINSKNPYQMSSWSLVPCYDPFQILWLPKCLRQAPQDRIPGQGLCFRITCFFQHWLGLHTYSHPTVSPTACLLPHQSWKHLSWLPGRPSPRKVFLSLLFRCFLRIQGVILWHFKTK